MACLSPGKETREKKRKKDKKKKEEEQARGLCPWASRVGLLVGAFADDSLRIWSIPLDPFLDGGETCEDEEEEDEATGDLGADALRNESETSGISVSHRVVVARSAEDSKRRKRRRDASEQKAFALEAKRSAALLCIS